MEGSVLVVENEEPVRQLLAGNLQNAGYKVHCAGDVPEAEALMRQIRPDLVVLSWILPGIPGLPFARRLRSNRRTKDISLVLISDRAEEQDMVAALDGGADDYLTKPYSGRELLARIKAVMRRRTPQLADDMIEIGGLQLDPAARRVNSGDHEIELWTTEFRLLHFFMTHPGRIFSRTTLLDEIWGECTEQTAASLEVIIGRLRRKLDAGTGGSLIRTIRGHGYRLSTGSDDAKDPYGASE